MTLEAESVKTKCSFRQTAHSSTEAVRAVVEWHDVVPFPSGNTALPANSNCNQDAQTLGACVSWTPRLSDTGVAGQSADLRPTNPAVREEPLAQLDSGTPSIVGPQAGVDAIFRRITNASHVGDGRFPAAAVLCLAGNGVDWVLGTPFLSTVYSVYSIGIDGREAPKVGLYPLRQPANASDAQVIFVPEARRGGRERQRVSGTARDDGGLSAAQLAGVAGHDDDGAVCVRQRDDHRLAWRGAYLGGRTRDLPSDPFGADGRGQRASRVERLDALPVPSNPASNYHNGCRTVPYLGHMEDAV
ncbi:hypothetical protein ACQY0O_002246 [Thecaphora frezii]